MSCVSIAAKSGVFCAHWQRIGPAHTHSTSPPPFHPACTPLPTPPRPCAGQAKGKLGLSVRNTTFVSIFLGVLQQPTCHFEWFHLRCCILSAVHHDHCMFVLFFCFLHSKEESGTQAGALVPVTHSKENLPASQQMFVWLQCGYSVVRWWLDYG